MGFGSMKLCFLEKRSSIQFIWDELGMAVLIIQHQYLTSVTLFWLITVKGSCIMDSQNSGCC